MLIGKSVYLRAMESDDIKLIVKWRNDPEVNKHFYEYAPLSHDQQADWWVKQRGRDDQFNWMICANEDKAPLGTVSIYDIDLRNRKAEWGRFYLVGDVRGKGYGRDVENLIHEYVFNHLNLNKLYCEVFADNAIVVNLHKKFGYKQDGLLRQHVFRHGEYNDVVALSLLKEEWVPGGN